MIVRLLTRQGMLLPATIIDVPADDGHRLIERGAACRLFGRTLADANRSAPYGLRKDGTPRAKPGPRAGG